MTIVTSETSKCESQSALKTKCDTKDLCSSKILTKSNEFSKTIVDTRGPISADEASHQVVSDLQLSNTGKSTITVPDLSNISMRPTQSHPKMSRMPRKPTLFKVGRTTRSLGSISVSASSENSLGTNISNPKANVEDETPNHKGSSSAGPSTALVGKRGAGNSIMTKQVNSQDSLKSINSRNPQNLTTNESPIDSKGNFILHSSLG